MIFSLACENSSSVKTPSSYNFLSSSGVPIKKATQNADLIATKQPRLGVLTSKENLHFADCHKAAIIVVLQSPIVIFKYFFF